MPITTARKEQTFSEDTELEVHYVEPIFAVDPQTRATTIKMSRDLINTGSHEAIKSLYPHLDDAAVEELLTTIIKKGLKQAERDAEVEATKILKAQELGVEISRDPEYQIAPSSGGSKGGDDTPKPKIANPVKHAEQSSIQPGRKLETGVKQIKTQRAEKQSRKESALRRTKHG